MAEFCFFENVDTNYKLINKNGTARAVDDRDDHNLHGIAQLDLRGPVDMHELFIDKLQFFIDSLALMVEAHIGMFTYLITNHNFKVMLLQLLEHGETHVRMKSHEILEAVTSYFMLCCPSQTVYDFPVSGQNGSSRDPNSLLLQEGNGAQGGATKKMEAEFIAHERLYISQIVIQVAKKSLQKTNDCYLQFNALILLDFLFQNLLPVPTFQNEQVKARKQNRRQTPSQQDQTDQEMTMDIEVLSISDMTPELDVMDPAYLRMRMKLVLSLWPHIQSALASPWSNIRSICYGLVCSMLKINVADYPHNMTDHQALSREIGNQAQVNQQLSGDKQNNNLSEILADHGAFSEDKNKDQLIMSDILSINAATQSRLKEIVLPMLYSLLSSKESESKAGGLNILGSFCGLSYDFSSVKINQNLAFLQRNSQFISLPIWRLVYYLQDDWDITIKEASVVLVQLCAPRNAILYFQSLKEKRQQKKIQYMMNQMPNTQSIYVKRGINEQEDEEEKAMKKNIRPESKLKIKNFLVQRNENAARAYMRFPNEQDLEVILGKSKQANKVISKDPTTSEKHQEASISLLQESTMIQEGLGEQYCNFSEYLAGKMPVQTVLGGGTVEMLFSQQAASCQMIEHENGVLGDKVHKFNPDFEDTRFVKNLSRKRQLEIELDMGGRGRKQQKETALNFFVDTYSDEQIQEIISIFRNDFKPPKNLWIEKQPSPLTLVSGGMSNGALMSQQQQPPMRSQSPDYYQDIYAEAIEQFNQQQAQMQQQQQVQLQQQVQSGSSSGGSPTASRESSALSQASSNSPSPSTFPAGSPQQSNSPTNEVAQQIEQTNQKQPLNSPVDSPQQSSPPGKSHNSPQANQQNMQDNEYQGRFEQQEEPVDGKVMHVFNQNEKLDNGLIESRNANLVRDKSGNKGGIWSPGDETEKLDQEILMENGPHMGAYGQDEEIMYGLSQEQDQMDQQHQQQLPKKSESMGLLDAEGYKFLELSDSNSDHNHNEEDQEYEDDARAQMIYEMRPPVTNNVIDARQQKRKAKKKQSLKIEQLNFDAIQICAQQQPLQQQVQQQVAHQMPRKANYIPKPQLQAVITQQQHGYQQQQKQQQSFQMPPKHPQVQTQNRIEFYEDPNELSQGLKHQQSSRLSQRSSRLQYQEELKQQQIQREPDEEARYIKTQKLFSKLKSPTDKIAGRGGINQAFSMSNQGNIVLDDGQQTYGRNKSNESRKRKKGTYNSQANPPSNAPKPNSKSFTKGGKPLHLQLIENDYFSNDDRHVTHLKNLTQKAVHHYQGGLSGGYQWSNNTNNASNSNVKGGMMPGQHSTRHRSKSISNANSISTPDFTALQNKLGRQGPSQEGLELTSSQELLDQNKISRKMAQTYLSGLSKGFIQNMDNLKLINTCLHQQDAATVAQNHGQLSSTQAGSNSNQTKNASSMLLNKSLGSASNAQKMTSKQNQIKKLINKSFENLGAKAKLKQTSQNGSLLVDLQLQNPKSTVSYQTHRSKGGKNSTLSSSPKRRDGSQTTRMGSSANYQRKQKSIDKGFGLGKKPKQLLNLQQQASESKSGLALSSGSNKKTGNISDLHLFIKTIEKDLTEKFKNIQDVGTKGPATPNQILRKVEDQMRAFGLDPKSGSNQATAQALVFKFAQSEHAQHSSSGNQHSQEKKRKKSLPPKLKLIGLNQVFHSSNNQNSQDPHSAALYTTGNQNITPSNLSSNGSGSYPFMTKSQKQMLGTTHFSNSTKKADADHYQRSSGSRGRRKRSGNRDRSAESGTSRGRTKSGRLSSGRGASSGSGGRGGHNYQMPYPPMVMTDRSTLKPNRPTTGGKSSQERSKNKSFTKTGGSALSKPSGNNKAASLHKLSKQQTCSPPLTQTQLQQQSKNIKNQAKMNKSKDNKGSSLSAMNQIATGRQADQQLLQQILNGPGGSISVRNSDYNSQIKNQHSKGNSQQMTNPFLLGKNSTTKMTPGSTKGSQTNRFQNNLQNNILFELLQSQGSAAQHENQAPRQSKKQSSKEVRQSGSQSSRVPAAAGGQPIKMIKNKKLQNNGLASNSNNQQHQMMQNNQQHQYD